MKLPEMHPVESSNLEAAGFEGVSNTLYVRFKRANGGATYRYSGVPHHVYQEFLEAERPGQYFAANIRDKFPTEKVIKPEETEPPAAL